MLLELRVENLLLIEAAELRLGLGLNVLTGETGAGKTILAHALDLLLGGRPRAGIVRPGAAEAYIEGVFELPRDLDPAFAERVPAGAEELVLARRVGEDGRTRAYLNGRTATVGDLREIGAGMIAFYGQHEHRRLTMASAQLDILDSFCGHDQLGDREASAAAHARVRELGARLDELRESVGSRERELDLLQFELDEIEAAAPEEAEYERLRADRERLRHLELLRQGAGSAAGALVAGALGGADTGGEGQAASALVAQAVAALEGVAGVDPGLDALTERCRGLLIETEDVGSELARYLDALESEPGGLEAVEERLSVLERLMRKHGGTIAAVLARAEQCRTRRDELSATEVRLEQAQAELDEAGERLQAHSRALRGRRRDTGPRLASEVRRRLAALAMEGASFEVVLHEREPGPTGADEVEFVLAANSGVPAGPVRDIASGGELSRVMLALMGAAHRTKSDRGRTRATIVFDEVDAGIGGHAARAVGEQLRALAGHRQILCITHLPQVASLAERHFSITKEADRRPARAAVRELTEPEVVAELVRMLGSDSSDVAARRHASRLRRAA
ncbi:MAG TPA: DNA repair protein RecN [Solirubrobacteraceae bacterium]|nr:DNA repair protein RecN [Solirubrobacteraceae bacterium]